MADTRLAAAPAMRLRAGTGRPSLPGLLAVAIAVAVVSASVPAGLTDRADGTGILIGASAALTGTAVVCPLALVYLVVRQLGGAEEAGRLRDLYLQHVALWIPRSGAVLAALRDWLWFTLAACVAGGLVGLGDSLRIDTGEGIWCRWTANPAAIIGVELYVLLLAVLWGSMFQNSALALLCASVGPILALGLLPLAVDSWLLDAIKSTPFAPLWASVSSSGFNRYDLAMSDTARYSVLAGWSILSILGAWLAGRRNRPALRQPGATS